MSRSGYSDEIDDNWALICWRGAVAQAIKGKRGQQLLRDLLIALDAMPVKRLIAHELEHNGEYCTLGVLGAQRQLPIQELDPYEYDVIADQFGVAQALVREIEFENDTDWRCDKETPEQRWTRMRRWVADRIQG